MKQSTLLGFFGGPKRGKEAEPAAGDTFGARAEVPGSACAAASARDAIKITSMSMASMDKERGTLKLKNIKVDRIGCAASSSSAPPAPK